MVRVSRRYIPHVAVLTALLAVPTLLHWQGRFWASDCRDPEAIFPAAAAPFQDETITAESRQASFTAMAQGGGWAEGSELVAEGVRVNWVAVRTYDPKRAFHQPLRRLVEGGQIGHVEVADVDAGGREIPVRWVHYEAGLSNAPERTVAGYLLVYRNRPVRWPYLDVVLSSPLQLVKGRLPMTLYFAFTRVLPRQEEEGRAAVRDFLARSWQRYRDACVGGARS